MDGKGTQGIAANGCGASGDMDCGGTARTGERTDGTAGGAAAGTPPRTFVPGEGGSRLLILVAYHRHGSSSDFLLETAEAYFRERDCGGFLFLCRMQASINAYDEYPHLNVLCNRLAGLLFRFRRERASEYRKGIPPMFGKADLQEVEKYLPHLRGCSFREEIALALPKVKNVEELARECAMSVNTLGRRFKEELNTTPHRWLTEQRKAHVTSLLADTDMPLQEIADMCGFATPSYLWDFCKKHLKATPAEIREIARCARTV